MKTLATAVVMLVLVMAAAYWPTGMAVMCLQCDGEDNACYKGANMTLVPCGGTCYWKLDISREFDVRRCHPFVMFSKLLGMNNNMEDYCYCNYNICNVKDCNPARL